MAKIGIASQGTNIYVWYMCDTKRMLNNVNVRIFGTGNPIDPAFDGKFIGTVITYDGSLVWHIFIEDIK